MLECPEAVEEFSKRERCRWVGKISPAKSFDCHQPRGQLAWELVNIPSRRANGCRRLAPTLQPNLAPLPQTSLLVWRPSPPLFAAFPLLYLGTTRGSFMLQRLLLNILGALHRCTTKSSSWVFSSSKRAASLLFWKTRWLKIRATVIKNRLMCLFNYA